MHKKIEEYINQYEQLRHQIAVREHKINELSIALNEKVTVLEEQIAYFKREFEREIGPINEKIDDYQQTLNKFVLTHQVTIKLGDIINELAGITGTDVNDIEISGHRSHVHYPVLESYKGFSNKDEILKYIAENIDVPVNVNISIYVKGHSPINITFDGYLSDIEADGKTLLEHSKKRPVKVSSFVRPEEHKESEILGNHIIIDKASIKNIMCSFNLKQIVDFTHNYDNDLLSKAVINCLNKQKDYEARTPKTLKKSKKQ